MFDPFTGLALVTTLDRHLLLESRIRDAADNGSGQRNAYQADCFVTNPLPTLARADLETLAYGCRELVGRL